MTLLSPVDDAVAAGNLRDALGARVLLAGDTDYDTVRTPWNTAIDQRPFAVALPETDDEVVAAVRAAAASGLRIAPQSTGHSAAALAGTDLSRTVVVSLRGMRGAVVDPVTRTAHVLGGSVWHDVVDAAAPHGLTALHGSASDVGVVGYALSGGISFYGRRHGLAVNGVRSLRVVTAAGELVTASPDENPDLFWALRGGSGAFGVVVSLEIDLLPYADVFAGMMLWDGARAAEVGHAWAEWSRRAPATATTSLRVMHFPPLPELPPFVSGRSVVVVDGAILETDAAADALLAPLRALEPEMDTFARMPAAQLVEVHMDPPEPSPAVSDHAMLHSLDAAAVDAFVAAAFEARPMISEIRHTGEAFARAAEIPGAISALDGEYLLTAISMVPVPEALPGMDAAVRAVVGAMAPWHGPALALTFIDRERDSAPGFGASAARLAELKRLHDPDDLFAAAHRVG